MSLPHSYPFNETDVLTSVLEKVSRDQCPMLPVMDGGRITGLLTMENVGELVMVISSMNRH